jgi:hypothetical protein
MAMIESHNLQIILLCMGEGAKECLGIDLIRGVRRQLVLGRPDLSNGPHVASGTSDQYSASLDRIGFLGMRRNLFDVFG